jgi:hypothetical protein
MDAALVPAVLGVMHVAHGAGMLRGAARVGPPVPALARAAGLRSVGDPDEVEIYAPSLTGSESPASLTRADAGPRRWSWR